MKIGFITRPDSEKWGGDLAVINGFVKGLKALGHEGVVGSSAFEIGATDFIFLSNSSTIQSHILEELAILSKPFGVLGFHEDILLYYTAATGMQNYVFSCLGYGLPTDNGLDFDIDRLFELPQLAYYYGESLKRATLYNHKLISQASLWIANSATEEKVMQRDHPGCKTTVIPVAPGEVSGLTDLPDNSFLELTGLSSKSYLLQVGRLAARKNQLGTLLASRNIDVPLVFIATSAFRNDYEIACFEAAARFRKAPTLFISENLRPMQQGNARVIPMPNGQKLPTSTLISAYHHAGLHVHPAFHELPGATYLEAARLGIPTVASSWCTITDYFYDPALKHSKLDGRIVYTLPHNLKEIEEAILANFGKTFSPLTNHPALQWTEVDAAKKLLQAIQGQI